MAQHMSLFPSPVKKKIKRSTNYAKCVICQAELDESLHTIAEQSYDTILSAANDRKDEVAFRLMPDVQNKEGFYARNPQWHPYCRGKWTRTAYRKTSTDTEVSRTSIPTRSSTSAFNYNTMCVICERETLSGKLKHEKLRKVEYETMPETLYNKAIELNDETLLFHIQGNDGKPLDMFANDVKYHKTCYDKYRLKQSAGHKVIDPFVEAFDELISEITEPLSHGKVFGMSMLKDRYVILLSKYGIEEDRAAGYRSLNLKRRLMKHFSTDILFIPQSGPVSELVCFAQITASQLVNSWQEFQNHIDNNFVEIIHSDIESEDENANMEDTADANKLTYLVSKLIASEITKAKQEFKEEPGDSWNTSCEKASSIIPNNLYNLLAFLLSSSDSFPDVPTGERVDLTKDGTTHALQTTHDKILSVAQNILFASGFRTPQHVSLAIYVYHKTRSKDLITVMNRLGLCISYTDLQRILTTVACDVMEQTESAKTYIPPNIVPGEFVQYAIDNLDFQECTLDGSSMHVTSMVMFQSRHVLGSGSIGSIPTKSGRRVSLPSVTSKDIRLAGKLRTLKRSMQSDKKPSLEWLLEQKTSDIPDLNMCWTMARLCPTKLLEIDIDCPGWKVFHANLQQTGRPVTEIGYCPFLDASPTDPNVVREALHICMKASKQLGQQYTVVTQDEAVYEISYTLRKQTPQDFDNLILRLGGFHLMMNYMGAVGKLMAYTGLKELFVDGKLLLEGTANKVLSGKGYYQGINAHIRVYEALQSLQWDAFEDWCISNEVDISSLAQVGEQLEILNEELKNERHDNAAEIIRILKESLKPVHELLHMFHYTRIENSTHQLWTKYIEMVDVMLLYLHSERAAVWSEHISAASQMAEYIAAADHTKYVKALTSYLEEMRELPNRAPLVHEEFEKGNFTVKRSAGKFNTIWTDMALECSQNCDAKGRSGQAGLIGLTMKTKTRDKWFLTLPFTASVSSAVKTMVKIDGADESHHENNHATQQREIESRNSVLQLFSTTDIANPFTYTASTKLINISSGLKASPEVENDLLSARVAGRKKLGEYINTGKLSKLNLHRFEDLHKSKVSHKQTHVKKQLTNEMTILKRTLLKVGPGDANHKFDELLKYEVLAHPPSISEVDTQTQKVHLRTGNKSALVANLRSKSEFDKWPAEIPVTSESTAAIVDVMGFVRARKPFPGEQSDAFANRLIKTLVKEQPCDQMHLIADRYDGIYDSADINGEYICLKDASGCRNHRQKSNKQYEIRKGQILSKIWDDVIGNSISKRNLLEFLFEQWCTCQDMLPAGLVLTLAGGFADRKEVRSIQHGVQGSCVVDELSCSHEEADTRLFIHAKYSANNGYKRVILRASDTDILVIALYVYCQLVSCGLKEMYIHSNDYFIPLHSVATVLGPNEQKMLPFIHALSGCDTNGFFYGKGKAKFMKAVTENNLSPQIAAICTKLEEDTVCEGLIDQTIEISTALLKAVYNDASAASLHDIRCHLYARKTDIKLLPPTDDSFRQHVLRALFQTCIWVKSLQCIPQLPDVFMFGWKSSADGVSPLLMTECAHPGNIGSDVFCNCKKGCTRKCSCLKNDVACDRACFCKGQPRTCTRLRFELDDEFIVAREDT